MMKPIAILLFALAGAACDSKPSEDDCRRAINRIRQLTGTANIQGNEDVESAVRSCRGNASKESVKCAVEASSLEQLERCGLVSKEDFEAIRDEQAAELKKQAAPATVDAGAAAPPPPVTGDAGAAVVTPAGDAGAAAPAPGAVSGDAGP